MGCCENLVKIFLFVTNLLIFLLSCAVLGFGIWVLVDKPSIVNLVDQTDANIPIYNSAVILFLVVASLAIVISFFGCCGAYKESKCMLGTYFMMVLSLLIVITVGTIIGFSQGIDAVIEPLKDTLALYDEGSTRTDIQEITNLWDSVQIDFKCCGVESARDWSEYNSRYNGQGYTENEGGSILLGAKVPRSCCDAASDEQRCMVTPSLNNGAFMVGCFTLLADDITDHISVVGGLAIAVLVIMTVDLVIAFYMCTCYLGSETDIIGRPNKSRYNRPGDNSNLRA